MRTVVTCVGWTNTLHEANRLRDFGHHTDAGYAACLQFPQILVQDSKKSASKRFRSDALVDATDVTKPDQAKRN